MIFSDKKCIACLLDGKEFKYGTSKICINCRANGAMPICTRCSMRPAYRDRRICQECVYKQERSRYHLNKKDPDFLNKQRIRGIKSYHKNIISNRDKQNAYARTDQGRFGAARRIAKRRNLDWKLTLEKFIELTSPPCFYCKNLLGSPTKVGLGLDRLNNSRGYEEGNIISCCGTCNKIRGASLTVEEAKAAINAVLLLRGMKNV